MSTVNAKKKIYLWIVLMMMMCFYSQVLLLDATHRTFFMETGKQMITGLMVKANKVEKILQVFASSGISD